MGPENDEVMPLPNQFFVAVSGVLYGRTFMASTISLMCLGPEETQAEDVIFVAMGADVPFVLCPQEDGNFKLVGECYVHSIMDGELFRSEANPTMQEVQIV
jgi:hypothetical protein